MSKIKIRALRYHEFIEYEMNGPTQETYIAESYKVTENQRYYWFITKDQSFAKRFNEKENWAHVNLINEWYVGLARNLNITGIDLVSFSKLKKQIDSIIKGQYVSFFDEDHHILHVDRLIGLGRHSTIQFSRVNFGSWFDNSDIKSIKIDEQEFDKYMTHEPGCLSMGRPEFYVIDNEYGRELYQARLAQILHYVDTCESKPLFGTGYQIESPDGELMKFRDIFELNTGGYSDVIDKYLIPSKSDEKGWEMIITELYYIQRFIPKEVRGILANSGYKLMRITAERMDCRNLVDKYLIESLINIEELPWNILDKEIPY